MSDRPAKTLHELFAEMPEGFRDIVQRRIANTGETLEEAVRAVARAMATMQGQLAAAPEGWAEAWLAEPPRDPSPNEREALRSQPDWMRALVVRFPPNCLVRTKEGAHHLIPARGCPAIVVGYDRDSVTVLPYPGAQTSAQCLADEVELVGCWRGWTPERVRQILDGLS